MNHQHTSSSSSHVRPLDNRLDSWGMQQSAPRTIGPGATVPTEQFLNLVAHRRHTIIASTAGVGFAVVVLALLVLWVLCSPDGQMNAPGQSDPLHHQAPPKPADSVPDIVRPSSSSSTNPGRTPGLHGEPPTYGALHRVLVGAPDPTSIDIVLPPDVGSSSSGSGGKTPRTQ